MDGFPVDDIPVDYSDYSDDMPGEGVYDDREEEEQEEGYDYDDDPNEHEEDEQDDNDLGGEDEPEYRQNNDGEREVQSDENDEENTEDNTEIDEKQEDSKIEEISLPEYIPEDYATPDFKDEKEELSWYRDKYGSLVEYTNSNDFVKNIANVYKDDLLQAEQDVASLKATQELLADNPESAIRMLAPQYAKAFGNYNPLNRDEQSTYLDKQLSARFGQDYREKYNKNEANDPSTESYKMLKYQEDLQGRLKEINNELAEAQEKYAPTERQIQEKIIKQYDDFKEDYDYDSYQNFIQEANNYLKTGNIKYNDIHKLMYFQAYIEAAYEEGMNSGKSGVINNIKRAGERPKTTHRQREPQEERRNDRRDEYLYPLDAEINLY